MQELELIMRESYLRPYVGISAVLYSGPMPPPGSQSSIPPFSAGPRPAWDRKVDLDGDVEVDLDKSTKDTYVVKQKVKDKDLDVDETLETFIHHQRGPGRKE